MVSMLLRKISQLLSPYIKEQLMVRRQLLGQELVIHTDTVRAEPDYDDAWMLACSQRAQVIFDVGANVGYDALLALTVSDVCQVVLVEANHEALAIAADNLIRNRLSTRARFVAAFAGARDDAIVQFWTVGAGAAGSIYKSHAVTAAQAHHAIQVPTITIDTLCTTMGLIPELIKIDVEGAEHDVLQGSSACAAKERTRFLVEMHSNPEMTMAANTENVLSWCREMRYQAWYLAEGKTLESPAQTQHRGRCHVLLQPQEWKYPDWLIGVKQSAALESVLNSHDGQPS